MPKSHDWKLNWAFGLSLLVLAINALISYSDLIEQDANTSQAIRSRAVLDKVSQVGAALKDTESARRGILIDGNADDHQAFENAADRVTLELHRLEALTKTRPDRHPQAIQLETTIHEFLDELRHSIDKIEVVGPRMAHSLIGFEAIRRQLSRLRNELQGVEVAEARYLAERVEERRATITRIFVTFSVASTLALVTIATTYLLVRRHLAQRLQADSQLRGSEERLRLMIESVRDYAIFSIDLCGKISSWNSGAERLFGFPEAAILGEATDRLFSVDDQRANIPALELATARTVGRSEDERWHVRADGQRFLASGLTTAVRDEKGLLLGFTKVARDITESKRVETELRDARDAAEVAFRAKSTFLANVGHELRTPLNAIIGYSELLHDEALDRKIPDFSADLNRIRDSGHLLLKLINNVLDLSKIEAGKMELADEPFDLIDLIRSVVRAVEPLAEKQGNTMQVIYPSDLGTLNADLAKVSQGLNHLMNNAVKFTESGIITFRVTRVRDRADREWISFVVADDGIGMTRDQISKLFQPFMQADSSISRRYGGTGLGLTITHRFCELMGGRLEVSSDPGQGSTFTMKLPTDRVAL